MILLLKKERRRQSGDTRTGPRARLMVRLKVDGAALTTVSPRSPLTERELLVLDLLEARLSSEEISACLLISVPAVRWHAANAYRKLRLSNRRPACRRSGQSGLPSGRTGRRGIMPEPRVVPIRGLLTRYCECTEPVDRRLRPPPGRPVPISLHQGHQVQDRRQAVERARTVGLVPVRPGADEPQAMELPRAPVYLLPLRRPAHDDCS